MLSAWVLCLSFESETVMKKAERPCKLVGYEGEGHAFFNERKREAHAKTLAEADSFLVDLGWIKK